MEEIREPSVAPRLSIILPAYNCEAFLEQTLDSMLSGLP
ncbi:MAG: glycosyltransferase [Clostridia bacterium]|jgi:glycosyltransferase involved in cell wall biosynthesis